MEETRDCIDVNSWTLRVLLNKYFLNRGALLHKTDIHRLLECNSLTPFGSLNSQRDFSELFMNFKEL